MLFLKKKTIIQASKIILSWKSSSFMSLQKNIFGKVKWLLDLILSPLLFEHFLMRFFHFFFEICMYGRISLDFKWKTTKSRNGLTIMKKEKKNSVNQGGCEYFVQPFCTLSSPMDYEKKIDGNLCQPLGSNFMIMIKIRPLV